MPSGPKVTSTACARQGDGERRVEPAAIEPVHVRLEEPGLAGVHDLEDDLRPVVEAKLDAAEGQELVALGRIVGLVALEGQVAREQELPLRALALEDGEDGVLERQPRPGDEADRGDVRRQAPERPGSGNEGLEDAVPVEVHLLDAGQLREAHVPVLVPRDAAFGRGALVLPLLALRRKRRRDRRGHGRGGALRSRRRRRSRGAAAGRARPWRRARQRGRRRRDGTFSFGSFSVCEKGTRLADGCERGEIVFPEPPCAFLTATSTSSPGSRCARRSGRE